MGIDFSLVLQSEAKKKVENKTTIYLDQNFWIRLRDASIVEKSGGIWSDLLFQLRNARKNNKIICVLGGGNMFEQSKIGNNYKRNKLSKLFEELSDGVCVRPFFELIEEEISAIAYHQQRLIYHPRKKWTFTHFICILGGFNFDMSEYEKYLEPHEVRNIELVILERMKKERMSELLDHLTKKLQRLPIEDYLVSVYEQNRMTLLQKSGRKLEKIKDVEFKNLVVSCLREVIVPRIVQLRKEGFLRDLSVSISDEFKEIRWVNTFSSIFAVHDIDISRPFEENDLDDAFHAASAIGYCDVFATERHLQHVCGNILKLDKKYCTAIISKPEELIELIKNTQK